MPVITVDRGDLRQRLYNLGIELGKARTADAILASGLGITDALEFNLGTGGTGDYNGVTIYRPTAPTVDQERRASVVSGSTLTHEGVAYGDLTTLAYELIGLGVRPDELNDVIRRMLFLVCFDDYWPVGWATDNDFASSSLTSPYSWTGAAVNTTVTKVTTGGDTTYAGQTGKRNLVTTNSSANGYTAASRLAVEPNDIVAHGFSARANGASMTVQYRLWDVTNNAVISTISYASRAFQHGFRQDIVPSGCYQVEQRLGGVESNAAIEWDYISGHLTGKESRQLFVPSWVNEQRRFLGFGPASYGRSTGTDRTNASSRQLATWRRGGYGDYQLYPLSQHATPQYVQVNRDSGLQTEEYWLHGWRALIDIEELDNETDTITFPNEEWIMEALQYLLYDMLASKHGPAEWGDRRDWFKRLVDYRFISQTPIQPKPEKRFLAVGL